MNAGFRRLLALVAVFATAFVAVSALRVWRSGGDLRSFLPWLSGQEKEFRPETFTLPEKAPIDIGDVELLSRLNDEYSRLTDGVTPSVVSIDTAGIRTERLLDVWGRARVRRYPTQGQGSGVIVTKEGHVVTNHHVIAGQQKIQVTVHGGKTYSATLIGEDNLLDIAVLKIDANETFTPLKLGDSSHVQVGQLVFAVGNPFGLGETVTQGIISAKERSISDAQPDLFQTDAAINPGNSGGPLVNLRGEIIGINVAIYSQDRENPGFQGVGFSIPSNDVKDALLQILERGRPIRGFLGVEMRDLNPVVRSSIGYNGEQGAAIVNVSPDSPAQKAGLQSRDVILSFNAQTIRNTSQLVSLVQRSRIGTKASIRLWRSGEVIDLDATITEASSTPDTPIIPPKPQNQQGQGGQLDNPQGGLEFIGLKVRDLTAQEAIRGFQGVVITGVTSDSAAAEKVLPGDLVLGVNNTRVSRAKEFVDHLAASTPIQTTTLHLVRSGNQLRIDLPAVPASK